MIATLALLAALASADQAPLPAPTVWLAADRPAGPTATRLAGELRGLGYAVVPAQMTPGEAADVTAQKLLDGTRQMQRAVVLLHATPALAELWWAEEPDRSEHEMIPAGEPSAWTRLDVIRVAETVRARVSPPIATPPVAAPEPPVVAAVAPVAPASPVEAAVPFVRVAAGAAVSGLGTVGKTGAFTLASSVALRPRTRIAAALTLPTDGVAWPSSYGRTATWDSAVAVSLEHAFLLRQLGPGQLELRAAAGLAVHHRTSSGTVYVPYGPYNSGNVVSYSAGPTLAGAVAYLVGGRYGLVATASGGATFPDRGLVVNGYPLSSPGHFNWSLGLMAEAAVWMHPSR